MPPPTPEYKAVAVVAAAYLTSPETELYKTFCPVSPERMGVMTHKLIAGVFTGNPVAFRHIDVAS